LSAAQTFIFIAAGAARSQVTAQAVHLLARDGAIEVSR